ncbi:TIGR04283 family arsenosugar biosynthesis glycosyltransferase [bacterium]|nr:TIGR04283 family arsenosugar biosynthesis glycosyltransferase [bacterium]
MISVIIPALNEAPALSRLLPSLQPAAAAGILEVIVSDGGSRDGTADTAGNFGARVVKSGGGRGPQLNAGAEAASGQILFFLHADAAPPESFARDISRVLADPGVAMGAFQLRIDAPGIGFRLIEGFANQRSRLLALPYGDQGFFIRRAYFRRLGGFAPIPIMEDVDLALRVRKLGKIVISNSTVQVSARRWKSEGWMRTSLRNLALLFLFAVGVPPRFLARFYPVHIR